MADDLDLSKLSDEQLAAYHALLTRKEMEEAAKNSPVLNLPRYGMPPFAPSALHTFDPMIVGNRDDADSKLSPEELKSKFNPFNQGTGATQLPVGGGPATQIGATIPQLASYLPGPGWLKMLNGMLTKTPADLATTAALGGAGHVADAVKATSPGANALLGALKGFGLYEGGTRLHDGLTGQETPPITQRNGYDLATGALATAAGGMIGHKEIPQIDPAAAAAKNLEETQQRLRAAQLSHTDLTETGDKMTTALARAKNKLSGLEAESTTAAKELAQGTNSTVAADVQAKKDAAGQLALQYKEKIANLQAQQQQATLPGIKGFLATKIRQVQAELAAHNEGSAREIEKLQGQKVAAGQLPSNFDTSRADQIKASRQEVDDLTNQLLDHKDVHSESKANLARAQAQLESLKKPDKTIPPQVMALLKKYLVPGLGGAGLGLLSSSGHSPSSLMSMEPFITGALGMGAGAVANTDAGQKLAKFLYNRVGSSSTKAIPAGLNYLNNRPRGRYDDVLPPTPRP